MGIAFSIPRRRGETEALRLGTDFLVQQQIQCKPHAEAGDVDRDVRQSALAVAGSKVDVHPVRVVGQKLFQKYRRQNLVGIVFKRALLDVGDIAFEGLLEVVVQWKWPDAFP